ncbi:MAG: TlpA family protein disulfide reductase [Frankiales bacterium]|nr:TlpA family protein disulfide reductase [Frankiales bacterium]
MNRRRLLVVVAAVMSVAAAVGVNGCSGTNAVRQDVNGSNGFQVGDDSTSWIDPGDRSAVNGVTGTLLDGQPFDLSRWRGHVVVVNFWGSWCGPCQAEAQGLEQVYRDNAKHGVEFVGVDIRDSRATAETFLRTHDVTYPNVFDPSNLVALQFRGVPPNATPTTIVLDRQGRVAARHSGEIPYTTLRDVVRRALAEAA